MDVRRTQRSEFLAKYGMLVIMLVILAFFSLASNRFLTLQNIGNVLIGRVACGCVALGGLFIITIGEFDLSLGYSAMFSMVIGAKIAQIGGPPALVILGILLTGPVIGLINGLIVVKLNVDARIVTLSMGLAMLGVAQGLTNAGLLNENIPMFLATFAQGKWGPLGYAVAFWLVLCVIIFYVFNETTFGRKLYAVGNSRAASFLAGIHTDRIRILAFLIAGLFSSVAGVIMLGQYGAASSAYGYSLLLPAYTTVFLGQAVFHPGYCNVEGMIVSLIFIGMGSSGIKMLGAPSWATNIYEGAVLIIAMLIAWYFSNRKSAV